MLEEIIGIGPGVGVPTSVSYSVDIFKLLSEDLQVLIVVYDLCMCCRWCV